MSESIIIRPQSGHGGANETSGGFLYTSSTQLWADIIALADADYLEYVANGNCIMLSSRSTSDYWKTISRWFNSFKLVGIPAGSTILSATFNFKCYSYGGGTAAPASTLVRATPSDPAELVLADFSNIVKTELAESRLPWDTTSGWKSIALNATALAQIASNLGAVYTLAMISGYDMDGISPTWASNFNTYKVAYQASYATEADRPNLTIEYELPEPAGSLFFGAEF